VHAMDIRKSLLHLSLIPGIGPATINTLIAGNCFGREQSLYEYAASDLVRMYGIGLQYAEKISAGLRDTTLLDRELELLEKHALSYITCADENYPSALHHIPCPPPVLYVHGALHAAYENTLAIVGARTANWYGKKVIEQLVPPLVASGWTIVSGGARGADSMAHEATLQAGGTTIAILGSGLLKPYPLDNKKLFERIVASGGALVSIFPLYADPTPGNFPARNRIIAGLSRGCVVVQAAARSGALITAEYALEQGRQIFAVPGPFDEPLSEGCHQLINRGARLTTTAADIAQEFELPVPNAPVHPTAAAKVLLHEKQVTLMQYCSKPTSFEELLVQTGFSLPELTTFLLELQLDGKLYQNPSGLWERSV
jgi:DNA processing protein